MMIGIRHSLCFGFKYEQIFIIDLFWFKSICFGYFSFSKKTGYFAA